MNRPDPDAIANAAVVAAGHAAADAHGPWATREAATIFWAAYSAVTEGHILARDADGVHRLDTGRLVAADVGCNGVSDMRETISWPAQITEEDVDFDVPLPTPEEAAELYTAHMRDRMWNTAQAHGAGVVLT